MTGRGAGYCAGYSSPGYMNPSVGAGGYYGWGRGRGGFGRGRGRGWRNWYYATGVPGGQRAVAGFPAWGGQVNPRYGEGYVNPYNQELTPEQEAAMLREESKAMQQEMDAMNGRIKELESAKDKK